MDFKAVFLDIDGTIVTKQRIVPSAHEAVERLVQKGYQVALCTGRSIIHARAVQRKLGLEQAVYFNGGLAMTGDDVALSMPLSSETVQRIIDLAERHQLHLIFHTQNHTLAFEEIPAKYQPILEAYDFPQVKLTTAKEILTGRIGPIYQANAFVTKDFDPLFAKAVPECLVYRWHPDAIDLQLLGCDKSMGAKSLLTKWDIAPAQAIHVGDGGNDIGMFRAMGLAIAMGNAEPDVQAHASIVTDSVENDGVLKALENLRLI